MDPLIAYATNQATDFDITAHVPTFTGPVVDVEVIVEPLAVARQGESREGLGQRTTDRARKLLEPLRAQMSQILLVLGDPAVEASDDAIDPDGLWTETLRRIPDSQDTPIVCAPTSRPSKLLQAFTRNDGQGSIVTAAFGITHPNDPAPDDMAGHAYAYVALIALGAQSDVDAAQAMVRKLAMETSSTAPLYVIGIATDGSTDTERWERLRASVVLLAGSGADDGIATVSRTPVDARQRTMGVSIVPCPPFDPGAAQQGVARVRIDVVKGQAQIAFNHDLGYNVPAQPVQIVRSLESASRVDVGERRLYSHVTSRIAAVRALPETKQEARDELDALLAAIKDTWDGSGYVQLCTEDLKLAGMPAVKAMSYMLLVVIRPREGGGYELLLSNHSPLQASPLGEWNTLLLPAFQYPATLLGHLRDDVIRQATERAEDLERAEHAVGFEDALERILDSSELDEDVWADEIREIANFTTRKFSPTSGVVTEFDYHFVTLLPLVERSSDHDDQRARDVKRLIAWFHDLDSASDGETSAGPARGLAMTALSDGGSAVRFDPTAELVANPDKAARAQAEMAPPGAVWFPIGAPGTEAPWRGVPSIKARNADVMSQLDRVLASELESGELRPELMLGGAVETERGYEIVRTFSWSDDAEPDPDVPGLSTVDALSKVTFAKISDLEGAAYPAEQFRQVYLRRMSVGKWRQERDAILVFAAARADEIGLEDLKPEHALGRLRPVQRYVLSKGLARVDELLPVFEQLAAEGNPWGFARVRKGGVGIPVSVTPPILEQLHADDLGEALYDGDEDRTVREFVVCDGTHRVVERVWRRRAVVPAILVDSQPSAPYYALPFGALEWDLTAARPLSVTPPQSGKYVTRAVPRQDAGANWDEVRKTPESGRYRRYYRDLESGFGRLGGQGGRMA
ncbi:hypothetical protein [Conexibacter woesei]|uniref:hypothetical protein n=1 Tax=Conexibacter woesei TaxID=191495 RepID=UPI0012DF0ACE|nr:hypothetical protein [Conexibacter woesei]